MTLDQLQFPILSFGRDGSLIPDVTSNLRATRRAVRRGYFDDLSIVASDGMQYRVVSVREISNHSLLSRLRAFFNGIAELKAEVIQERPVSLEELRNRIFKYFEADLELWESRGDIEELKSRVAAAPSHREIIQSLL